MKKLILMLFAGFIGFALVTVDAEARRLGGGRSLGRSAPSSSKKPAPPPQQAAPQQQSPQVGRAPTNQRPSGASRWLGPLAGLAAGGLLASLLFGDGFEGFRMMDFLLMGLLVLGAVMLFRALRSRAASHGPPPTSALAGVGMGSAPRPHGGRPSFEIPEIGAGRGGGPSDVATQHRPAWFDEEQFLEGAKTHFVRLQAAWDAGNLEGIREYTTPELFTELATERQSYGGQQHTEVVSLDTALLGLVTEGDKIVASVRYSGMIREQGGAPAHSFAEIWHVERALDSAGADWYVAGIEQEA
jgi:predicted lipid-binding transport protein (Tim44 family)